VELTVPPLRVGRIAYLNVEPFFHAFPWPLSAALPPRALGEALARGEVDAGPLPLADCLRLAAEVTVLPFGIVCPERAQSVCLYARRPLVELGGRPIAVTGETATSVRLLRILLAFREEVTPPVLVELGQPADGVLLIGDDALQIESGLAPAPAGPFRYDIGEEWTRWTGLPAVFAAWAVRRAVPAAARAALAEALAVALERGLAALPEIAAARRDLGLSEAAVLRYLRGFRYRLGAEEDKAIAEFRRLLLLLEA
jgi:chorismate dehydratase